MVPRSERPMYRGNLWLIFITEISSLHFSKKMAREKYHLQPSDWSYFEFIFTISSGTLIIHLILKSLNFCHLKIISCILLIQTSVTLPLTSLLDDKLDSTFTEKKEAREDPINVFTNMSIYLPLSSCITTDLLLLWMDCQLLHLCNISFPVLQLNYFAFAFLLLLLCFLMGNIIVFLWPQSGCMISKSGKFLNWSLSLTWKRVIIKGRITVLDFRSCTESMPRKRYVGLYQVGSVLMINTSTHFSTWTKR